MPTHVKPDQFQRLLIHWKQQYQAMVTEAGFTQEDSPTKSLFCRITLFEITAFATDFAPPIRLGRINRSIRYQLK